MNQKVRAIAEYYAGLCDPVAAQSIEAMLQDRRSDEALYMRKFNAQLQNVCKHTERAKQGAKTQGALRAFRAVAQVGPRGAIAACATFIVLYSMFTMGRQRAEDASPTPTIASQERPVNEPRRDRVHHGSVLPIVLRVLRQKHVIDDARRSFQELEVRLAAARSQITATLRSTESVLTTPAVELQAAAQPVPPTPPLEEKKVSAPLSVSIESLLIGPCEGKTTMNCRATFDGSTKIDLQGPVACTVKPDK
jgi:hypothetical protein